jgi:hypothetical protein
MYTHCNAEEVHAASKYGLTRRLMANSTRDSVSAVNTVAAIKKPLCNTCRSATHAALLQHHPVL